MPPTSRPPAAAKHPHPALVLGVYGEELANGARTAIFGNATLGLAEELVERGARLVHVFDPDGARIAEASARPHDRSIFYAPLPEGGDVGVRDGAFDFVLVPDLSIFSDPAALIAVVRRVVSKYGAALVASPNVDVKKPLFRASSGRSALGYYELYEAVAAHFASVRMIGQAPFVGYAVAELSIEDPDPTIDSSLAHAEGKEPDWFLALVSDRNVHLDPFALIELPVDLLTDRPSNDASAGLAQVEAPSAAGAGTVLINILEAEREAALESLRQQEQAIEAERFRAQQTAQSLAAAQEEVTLLRERCRSLEDRVVQEEGRRSALEITLERPNPEIAPLRDKLRVSDERTRSVEDRLRKADERARGAEERGRGAEERLQKAEERARGAEEQVKKAEERARGAEEQVKKAEERARGAEEQVKKAEERARGAEEQLQKAEVRARAAVEKSAEKAASVEEQRRKADERVRVAEERLRTLETQAREVDGEHEGDIARLEAQLKDRGREIQGLRDEVERRAKIARELIMTNFPPTAPASEENGSAERHPVIPAASPAPNGPTDHDGVVADLSAKLDRLASDAARREADLVGAKWKIAQLERDLTPQR